MKQIVTKPRRIEGTVTVPGDRSIAHRAVLLNSIANGPSTITNYSTGADGLSMLRCLKALGADIKRITSENRLTITDSIQIDGNGLQSLKESSKVLNAGNSGATMRQIAGLMSGQPYFGVITGDKSLRSRPMSRIIKPLKKMGAQISGRSNDSLAPLSIKGGNLTGIEYRMPVASAQLKSSILIAGLFAEGETRLIQPLQSRDHTERMLGMMKADIEIDGKQIKLNKSTLTPVDVNVPGDFSAAAYWIVAGCCHPNAKIRITNVGINPTRTGALDILMDMGANIRFENLRKSQYNSAIEPTADIVVESSQLTSVDIEGDMVPRVIDELPILALAACVAQGTTRIKDASELRVKESDRIATTAKTLSDLKATVEERPDGLVIQGNTPLVGTELDSFGDHRIAMSMAIAGMVAHGQTTINGAEVAKISYPDFWDTVDEITK